MSKVFLYKIKNSDDRDCVAYIEDKPMRFECGHYFGGVNLYGSCYSSGNFSNYEDIETILTEDEYNQLLKFNKDIHDLGYGIEKGSDRYNLGIKLCENIQDVYDKLNSEENEKLFEMVSQEEMEYLKEYFSLNDNDIKAILDEYRLEYKDRSIVGSVYENAYELGEEETFSLGLFDDNGDWSFSIIQRHFDFESFGEEIADDGYHVMLDDGRIVSLNY